MNEQQESFAGWAIVEVMGHRRLGGYVRETTLAGAGVLRVDIPGSDGATVATQFIPPHNLYCLTPTTEEIARAVAKANQPEPVQRWELPAATRPVPGEPPHETAYDAEYNPEDDVDDEEEGPAL